MKITDVQAIILKQEEISDIGDGSQDTVVILVETDEGITGVGEVDDSPYVIKAIIDAKMSHMVCMGLRDVLVGEDPFNISALWNKMYEKSYYYGRRSVGIHAMSGIEMALWDIKGKALGLPVYQLLGGAYRTKIPAYCSVLMPETEDGIKRIVDTYMPQGFKGIKFGWGPLGQDKKNDLRLIRAARKAIGDDALLAIDIGMAWKDTKTATQMCHELEDCHLDWIEEPLSPDNIDGMRRLNREVRTKISGGEEVGTLYELNELIQNNCVDILQPDMSRCGGISIAKTAAEIADLKSIQVIPHAFKTGILMSASLHFIASVKNTFVLEYCNQETVLSKHLIRNHYKIDGNGMVTIPDGPGLGFELNEEILNRYRVS